MSCKKCGCCLEEGNIIQRNVRPHTFWYVLSNEAFHYKASGNYNLLPDWKKTDKYWADQNDPDSTEGAHVNDYFCRKCGKKYTEEEIIAVYVEAGKFSEH